MTDERLKNEGPHGIPSFLEPAHRALTTRLAQGKHRKYIRFLIAALSSIPWVGGVLAASASLTAENEQQALNDLQQVWLEDHKLKVAELGEALSEIFQRLDNFGDEIKDRMESPEYLGLVKATFRVWDQAETQEKRDMLKRLIVNAGAIHLCDDDLIRLFLHWIEQYHETHFMVAKAVYEDEGITRAEIWTVIKGAEYPREDSHEADLFKYLVRELSMGGVIRQERVKDAAGNFRKKAVRVRRPHSNIMTSAFDDNEGYEMTELGKKFIHYVQEDAAAQLDAGATGAPA
jgi:hypothetical protein